MTRKQHTARLESIITLPTPEPQLTARAVPVRVCSPEHANQARLIDVVDGMVRFSSCAANLNATQDRPSVLIQQRSAKDGSEPWRTEIQSSVATIREKFIKLAARNNSMVEGPLPVSNRSRSITLKNARSACKSLGSLHDLISDHPSSVCIPRNVTIIQVPAASRRHSLSSSEEESYV
jgi:hypothetical protein